MTSENLIDLLDDLKHDLGKYLVMPLSMLPADADDAAVRRALDEGLHRTRRSAGVVHSARDLWQGFVEEAGDAFARGEQTAVLERAVANALAWSARLQDGSEIDRTRALSDLRGVGEAIGALLGALRQEVR